MNTPSQILNFTNKVITFFCVLVCTGIVAWYWLPIINRDLYAMISEIMSMDVDLFKNLRGGRALDPVDYVQTK